MKSRFLLASLVLAILASAGIMIAAEKEQGDKKFTATCPVSGRPAKEDSVATIEKDLKVYFCCDKCPVAFEKNPEKFDMKVRRQLLETGQMVQVACPITGKPVNPKTMVKVGQAKAGFCCKNCLAKYNKADDQQKLVILFADLPKAFTRQTKCPVSGKPINPEAVVKHDGKKVYFCCENCPKAFAASPEKYMEKLPQFTYEDDGLPATEKEKS